MSIIKNTIESKIGFDIYDLDLKDDAKKCKTKALFLHSKNDQMINLHHTINLIEN